jgi:uncharacterized membrane protein YesL
MDLFNINGKFYSFMTKVADLIILSVLWLLTSLPVITLGASSSALYYSVIKVVRKDSEGPVHAYFKAFKGNFKQGTVITVAVAAFALLVTAVGTVVYRVHSDAETLQRIYTIYLILLGIIIAWLHYLISYIARFQAPLKTVLKNSLVISLVNLPQSVSMMILFTLCIVGFILSFPASAMVIILAPGVYALLTSYLVERIYHKYQPEETEEASSEET